MQPSASLLFLLLIVLVQSYFIFGEIINTEVTRTIDATTAILKINAEIKASGVNGEYQLAFPEAQARHISFMTASAKGGKQALVIRAPATNGNITFYAIEVKNEASPTIKLNVVLTNFLEPFPATSSSYDDLIRA